MKYHCGHQGCDICGARECTGTSLQKYGDILVCLHCVRLAVKVAVQMAETFGGTIIAVGKVCGKNKEAKP